MPIKELFLVVMLIASGLGIVKHWQYVIPASVLMETAYNIGLCDTEKDEILVAAGSNDSNDTSFLH